MARTAKVAAVKVRPLKLSQSTQKFSIPKTTVPTVKMDGGMLNSIKQSPKGVLPAGLVKLIGKGQ